jgi:hypothetical protein
VSFDEYAPWARIICHLSRAGVLDAVRHGWTVSSDSTVEVVVTPNSEVWDLVFELFPDPLPSNDGTVEAVQLVVGRSRTTQIDPSKPFDVDAQTSVFEEEILVWPKPEVVVDLGTPQKLDRFFSDVEGILRFEAGLVNEFTLSLDAAEREASDLNYQWQNWVGTEGVKSTKKILNWADDLAKRAADVSNPGVRLVVNRQRSEISKALNAVEAAPMPLDDAYIDLMDAVCKRFPSLCTAAEEIERGELRRKEVAEAEGWVRAVGSTRLRKALQTGTLASAMGAYRDERLSHERPGWSWWDVKQIPVKSIVNPSESDLDDLIEARSLDPDAKLAFNPNMGSVITSTFLGRPIIKSQEPF